MNTSRQAPETPSKPVRCNEINLSNENQAELSRMSLENTAVKEKHKEPNSTTPLDDCRFAVRNRQIESSRGKPSKDDQRHQICQRNRGYVQKSVKRTAAAPRLVKPIQVETNAAQPVKESELHNPLSNRVRKPTEQNRVAQPVKESENHINPTSSGVRKSIQQNKVSQSIKKSSVANKTVRTVNSQKVSLVKEKNEAAKSSHKSIKQKKVAQPVKESEMHINPPSDGVRKSIEQNKVTHPVKESENHIKPSSSGVQKSIRQNKVSQPVKKSVANKTARTVNPQKVLQVKEKNEAAKSSPKPSSKPAAQLHYIQWHGFESFHESIGWSCSLCENDLSHSPTEEEHETDKFPDVAVLPCGHAFHNVCLHLSTSKLQCSYPPCIICTSFQS